MDTRERRERGGEGGGGGGESPASDIDTCIFGYLSEKVTYWLFKIFEIQNARTFSFNDILRLCTIVVNIAIRICA